MSYKYKQKLSFIYKIIHIIAFINIIYTIARSLVGQNRSKDLDSPTLYQGGINLDNLSELI